MNERSRKEITELVEKSSGVRHELFLRLIEGKVSQDNVGTIEDVFNLVDENLTPRSIKLLSTRTCDFGHLLDQKVRLVNKCERCGLLTCSSKGCSYTCQRCGRAFCRRHVSVYSDGQAYCSNCKWHKRLMILFEIIKKVVK